MATLKEIASAAYTVVSETYGGLSQPETSVERSFVITNALTFGTPQRLLAQCRNSDKGRRLLRERPDIKEYLCNREYLSSCPPNSLGRCFLEFAAEEGITIEKMVEASADSSDWQGHSEDPDIQWTQQRLRDTHDLWHCVLGYRADFVGEFCITNFSFAQSGHLGMGYLAAVGMLLSPKLHHRFRIIGAFFQGLSAEKFLVQDWESMLELPIEEVRRRVKCREVRPYETVRGPLAGEHRDPSQERARSEHRTAGASRPSST